MKVMVFDVGGTEIKYSVMDEGLNRTDAGSVPTPQDTQEHFLDTLYALYSPHRDEVSGIAMALPGFVDTRTGFVSNGGALLYNTGTQVGQLVRERCGCPVTLENDGKAAALAELQAGALQGCCNAAVFIIGTGVGGGIIANGQLGTTAEAEAVIAREGKKIVAAINGNFYNCWYDRNKPLSVMENNYPRIYGAIVTDGKMLNSGASVALGIASDGSMKIARATIKGTLTLGRTRIVAWCVNTSNSDPQACYILTDELALGVDIPESSEIVIVRDGTVEDVQSGCANFRTPSGAVAMVLNSGCYVRGMARVGMRAEYGFCVTDGDSDMENMKNIIGGTGMIVEHGVSAVDNNPNVTADDQDPDTVSVRSFAAITADGRLMLATVTSSYRAIAQSLVQMGVQDAMTLDGGASSMLYANGRTLYPAGREMASILAVLDDAGDDVPAAKPAQSSVSSWAQADVEQAAQLGILPQSLQSSYQTAITRGEFCRLLSGYLAARSGVSAAEFCRNRGIDPASASFSDTADADIRLIAATGVVTGYPDGTFRPDAAIARQDAAIMLKRLAGLFDVQVSGSGPSFTDAAQISDYAKDGVSFATAIGLMNGHANGSFAPRAQITREQAVVTVMNAWRKLG